MSKFDRVDLRALGACCVDAVQQRPQLAAEGDVMCCRRCPAVLAVTGGVWSRRAGFAALMPSAALPSCCYAVIR